MWYLGCQSPNEELSGSRLIEQGDTEIDGVSAITKEDQSSIQSKARREKHSPPGNVIFIQSVSASRLGQVDDSSDLMLLKYFSQLPLVLDREENLLDVHVWQVVDEPSFEDVS